MVPCGRSKDWGNSNVTVAGILFADDAVGLCPSVEAVEIFCRRVTDWTSLHEMKVGIRKCGILEIPPAPGETTLGEHHELRPHLAIGGEVVPLVSEYKYLGVMLESSLDSAVMV